MTNKFSLKLFSSNSSSFVKILTISFWKMRGAEKSRIRKPRKHFPHSCPVERIIFFRKRNKILPLSKRLDFSIRNRFELTENPLSFNLLQLL